MAGQAGAVGIRTNHVRTTGDQAGAEHGHSEPLQQPWGEEQLRFHPVYADENVELSLVRDAKADQGRTMQSSAGVTSPRLAGQMGRVNP